MAIWVKIRKEKEQDSVGFYEVYKQDYKTIEFYMSVNLKDKKINFYLTHDFASPAKIIDCNLEDEPIGAFPGVSEFIYIKSFMQALRAIDKVNLPEVLDYIA